MKKQIIIANVLFALAMIMAHGVLAAGSSVGPAVYLFLNEKDQDSGCKYLYSIYEGSKAGLPKGVKTARLDVNDTKNEPLFKRFDVRILPTVLFVNGKGEATKKIFGEGADTEKQLKAAFQKANEFVGK